jgi:hypothetical protein
MTSSYYATRGDIVHGGMLVASMLYAGCVFFFTQPGRGVFDDHWKRDGFCIHNKSVPFWSSFDTCLYVDTFFSLILAALWVRWRSLPGMERASELVPFVVAGTLGHGFAHGAMASKLRDGGENASADNSGTEEHALWQYVLFAAAFWFPLLKASMVKVSNLRVALLSGLVTYASSWLKPQYGFAYVQTVLSVAYHASQLRLPPDEKEHREHLTLPLMVALPPLLTAWNEALFCSAYFRSMGGHTLYDASIILCFIGFYADAYRHAMKQEKDKKG